MSNSRESRILTCFLVMLALNWHMGPEVATSLSLFNVIVVARWGEV